MEDKQPQQQKQHQTIEYDSKIFGLDKNLEKINYRATKPLELEELHQNHLLMKLTLNRWKWKPNEIIHLFIWLFGHWNCLDICLFVLHDFILFPHLKWHKKKIFFLLHLRVRRRQFVVAIDFVCCFFFYSAHIIWFCLPIIHLSNLKSLSNRMVKQSGGKSLINFEVWICPWFYYAFFFAAAIAVKKLFFFLWILFCLFQNTMSIQIVIRWQLKYLPKNHLQRKFTSIITCPIGSLNF